VHTNGNPSTVPGLHIEHDPKAPVPAGRPDALRIVALTLQPGEELIVGRRIREVLTEARKTAGA
jgi:hypothetical protein